MEHFFYIIVGASATGKGVLMEQLCKEGLWEKGQKFATRSYRGADDDITPITGNSRISELEDEERNLKEIIEKDLPYQAAVRQRQGVSDPKWALFQCQNDLREERLKVINECCGQHKGIVYFLNGNYYGIRLDDVPNRLEKNNVVVVCSDFRVIKQLKNDPLLGGFVRIIYIASSLEERELLRRYKERETICFDGVSEEAISEVEGLSSVLSSAGRLKYYSKIEEVIPDLNDKWNRILPYYDTIRTRSTNIRLLYNRYIDHISEIDCPILNYHDLEYMFEQQRNFITHASEKRRITGPPIFMVCAAPSSGKATLMSVVGGLGEVNKNIKITTKYATRKFRPTDGRDGMIAINKDGNFSDHIKREEDIWSWEFHGKTTKYAVDLSEIRRNIESGQAQIFISNMGQISRAHELFPNNIVVLYLHATHETATGIHIYEKRKSEIIDSIREAEMEKGNMLFSHKDAAERFSRDENLQRKLKENIETDKEEIKKISGVKPDSAVENYVDNNYRIDHVLLNTGSQNDLIEQMVNLIDLYTSGK